MISSERNEALLGILLIVGMVWPDHTCLQYFNMMNL